MLFRNTDKLFLSLAIALTLGGFLVFISASLARIDTDLSMLQSMVAKQFLIGIVGGALALCAALAIHYRFLRRFAFYILLGATIITCTVFIPGVGVEHGGARRWIEIGGFSVQPAEFLKLAYIIYVATWFSGMRKHINSWKLSILPISCATVIVMGIMYAQKDTDGLIVMLAAALALFFVAGASLRSFAIMAGGVATGLAGIIITRPYILARIATFYNMFTSSGIDRTGAGWQIYQSLIAIGSGGIWGRGFGQSIQKFDKLPEAATDSIFAVLSEEWGFIGTSIFVILFALFILRGYYIATHSKDPFATLLVVGIITMIAVQAMVNIAAVTALIPLSGLTLPFVSQGGSSLLVTLLMVGIILNVSKQEK